MLNDSQPPVPPEPPSDAEAPASVPATPKAEPSRRHPLERAPQHTGDPAAAPAAGRRINLRIPTVTPRLTYILIGLNVAIFVLRAFSLEIDRALLEWGANNPGLVLQNGEFYRLFTSMFLHAGIYDARGQLMPANAMHILFNMLALYSIGSEVERYFGHLRFALIYLLGGLSGSILSALLSGPEVFSIGASGAVFAILGAEMVFLYKHRRLFGAAGRQRLQNTVILLVINLGFGLVSAVSGSVVRIDNWAHIGGVIGGVVVTWFIGPFFNLRRHPQYPEELLAEDINPVRGRYRELSLYFCGMLGVLIAARLLLQR
jgi:rhomboid protease GluP